MSFLKHFKKGQSRDSKISYHSSSEMLEIHENSANNRFYNSVYQNTTEGKINPTWWRRRSALERGLTIIAVCGVLTVIALAIAVGVLSSKAQNCASENDSTSSNCKDVCLTPGCINTASRVLEYMDSNVEPCDDFYRFACGNFLENTVIPDDKTAVSAFSVLSEKLQEQLRINIEEKVKQNEKKHFKLVKNLYKNCMNQTAINQKGLQPVKDIVRNLGGWPILDGNSWLEGDFEWKQSVKKFRHQGFSVDYFFDFSINIDFKNSTKRVLDIDQTSLSVSREYLTKGLSNDIVKAYYNYMVDIAVIFGADRDRAEKELKQSLEFEIKLANISLPTEKRRNITALYNPMTIRQLQTNYPSISWKEYFNAILEPIITIGEDEVVIVNVPTFFKDFEKLMEQTPKRVQANYVMWRAVAATISYLNDDVRRRQLQYSTAVSGKTEREPRWKECIDLTSGNLGLSVGALYVRKYFNEESKKSAVEMVTDIRKEFRKILETVDWMDEKTRKSALEKAMSMSTHIAYPDELLDDKKLEEFYENLELNPGDYLQSILNLTQFATNYSFSKLRKPFNKTDWLSHGRPAVVNAFYSSIENSIQFPAGILQGTFFSKDRPRYMNYGAIGFVIGHEITHGFDDQGRQFDKEGNLVEWWESETKEKYLSKAECIIHQYGNYTAKEVNLNLNGINTQGENIADNGGIKESYLAYQEWVERNGHEPKLPGLKYTPSQLFWISAAQTWCSKYRPETLKLRITTGVHSPGEFRVLGPLSNRPEFAKDFNCPIGSTMNPKKKCFVW
ncbi:neprilysin-2 isoform X2 [Leptopilina heterotoma]|uniref:neprilysin-2 isoform X2 n=1 Tax=Leptopilina heterotoma TaxID=63436 RepID=UPI001CAA0290|nr:neprilysin-2 isoform X2 [Leptopilina heterotoma]